MDKRELKIDYFVCRNSVPACYEELSEKALAAAGKAYCIYSDFAVGAAVLLENGTIVLGNNQENVAYPSGMCAERTALFYAGAAYPDVPVKALAIAACFKGRPRKEVVSPCGACRQVMAEFCGEDFKIFLSDGKEIRVYSLGELLPFSFDKSFVKGKECPNDAGREN